MRSETARQSIVTARPQSQEGGVTQSPPIGRKSLQGHRDAGRFEHQCRDISVFGLIDNDHFIAVAQHPHRTSRCSGGPDSGCWCLNVALGTHGSHSVTRLITREQMSVPRALLVIRVTPRSLCGRTLSSKPCNRTQSSAALSQPSTHVTLVTRCPAQQTSRRTWPT